jgi:hypothetical protein
VPKLNIHVNDQNGKTQSQFGKAKDSEKIVFFNDSSTATLTVTIQSQPGMGVALCDKNGLGVDSFTVAPTEKTKAFTICNAYQGTTFKYTAQVGTAAVEDPIIIIERYSSIAISVPLTTAIGIAAVALVAGAAIATWWSRRQTPA